MATQEEARQAILDVIVTRANGNINAEGVRHIAEAWALVSQPAQDGAWREQS